MRRPEIETLEFGGVIRGNVQGKECFWKKYAMEAGENSIAALKETKKE